MYHRYNSIVWFILYLYVYVPIISYMCESRMRFKASLFAAPLAFWPSWPRDRNSLASGLVGQESSTSLGTLLMDSFEKWHPDRQNTFGVFCRHAMPHMAHMPHMEMDTVCLRSKGNLMSHEHSDLLASIYNFYKVKSYQKFTFVVGCHGMSWDVMGSRCTVAAVAFLLRSLGLLPWLHTPVSIHGSEISFQSWTRDSVENWWLTVVFMTLYSLTSGHWNAPFLLYRWLGSRACWIANVMCVSAPMNRSFCYMIPTWIGW